MTSVSRKSSSGTAFFKMILVFSLMPLTTFAGSWRPDTNILKQTKKSVNIHRIPASMSVELPVESILYEKLRYSIFEIVVPKVRDTFVEWERPLPYDLLPYSERTNKYRGLGTAFAVGVNRFVSCAHVFPFESSSLQKEFFIKDQEGITHRIRNVTRVSNNPDIIEFDLETQPAKVIPLKISQQINIGQTVYVVGNALGEGISFRSGQVASRTPEEVDGQWEWIRFSAPASPGNSGGPLLTSTGQVIGIVAMKSQTENLNYAVPMSEWKALSTREGRFHRKRIGFDYDRKPFEKPWNFLVPLPKPMSEVTQGSIDSINKILLSIASEIRGGADKNVFPFKPSLQEFFRHQLPPANFGNLMVDDSLENWTVEEVALEKIKIGQNDFIATAQEGSGKGLNHLFFIKTPADMSLKQFINNPKLITDSFLKTRRIRLQMAGGEIAAVSFGTPSKSWRHFDAMGRPWQSAVWLLPEGDSALVQNCLATPTGAACNISMTSSSQLEPGIQEVLQLRREKTIVSLSGTPQQWIEYLSLGKDFVPSFANSISVSETETKFEFKFDKFRTSFKKSEWHSQGIMIVRIGFSPNTAYSMEPLQISFFPEATNDKVLTWVTQFEPMPTSSDQEKNKWVAILKSAGVMNGQPFLDGDLLKIVRPLKTVENQGGIEKRYVAVCQNNKLASELLLRHDCARFNFELESNEGLATSGMEYRSSASIKTSVR